MIQSAFANDLPDFVKAMTEYILYEFDTDVLEPEEESEDEQEEKKKDEARFIQLKSFDQFKGDDIVFKRNGAYLDNMLKEVGYVETKGKRKNKPVDFQTLR